MDGVIVTISDGKGVRRRVLAALSAVFMVTAGLVAVAPAAPAQALRGTQFNPNLIITDANFYDANAMTEAQIQTFLEAKEPGTCANANCLKLLRMDTTDKPQYFSDTSGKVECLPYQGAPAERASTIIFKVQQACGISAKVILVTLHKEQGLITKMGPSDSVLSRAMGMGCPDHTGGTCDAQFYGFHNQVWSAARQFKVYKAAPKYFNYQAGRSQNIYYNPNSACGAQWVYIYNAATAGLYNYTPYVPNASALNNLRGTGDACGSYGNRNFWVYYNDWFGSPTDIYPPNLAPDRVGGEDRYSTAVKISAANFPSANTVYVASGADYPDAVSAGPAAAAQGAPLLLVQPTGIPSAVQSEIQRLHPAQIVVVGGNASVSDAVYAQLATMTTSIRRDGGEDRYGTSRAVAQAAFGTAGSTTAYIATGAGFPDALSASAAAGSKQAPVVLVDGASETLSAENQALLTALRVQSVVIVGGPAVVTTGMESALRTVPGVTSVVRLAGDTRYGTSVLTNRANFTAGDTIYVASGMEFPDALAGAAVAGAQKAPLYLVPPTCLLQSMLQDVVDYGATKMIILGGPAVVGAGVASFVNCS
jgi:putative cell wall-binding protein